jgi:hypothetical protein
MKKHLLILIYLLIVLTGNKLYAQNAPSNFTGVAASGPPIVITLSWTPETGGNDAGYVIRARRVPDGVLPPQPLYSSLGLLLNDTDLSDGDGIFYSTNKNLSSYNGFTGLDAGATYEFYIHTVDNNSLSPASTTTVYTLAEDPAAQPVGFTFTATPTLSQINLSFTAPSAWSSTGYVLYRQAGGTPAGSSTDGMPPAGFTDFLAIISGSGTTAYSDMTAVVGTTYTYALVPFNVGLDGNSDPIPQTYNYGAVASLNPSASIPLTATLATNNGGLTNINASETNEPIFGFSAQTNGTQSIDNVVFTITTSATLSDILTSFVLKDDGTNATYSGAGTTLGAVSVTGTAPNYTLTFDLTGSPVALSGTDKYFYLVADAPSTAPLTSNIQVDLTTVGVIPGIHSSLAGFNRTFDVIPLTATLAANNGALGNVAASNTNKPIFGFRAQTNGTQSIDNVVFTITTSATLSDILTSFVLKDDGTNATYSGAGTTLGAVSVTGTAPNYTLTFDLTGSPVALSGTDKYFYLVADAPGAAPPTENIQIALTTIGVIPGIHSSLAGFNRTFDVVALTTTLATNNGALGNMVAGNTNKPIFGFRAQSNGTQSINNVVFTITTSATLSDILTSFVLKDDGANATYSGAGITLGAVSVTGTAPNYTLTFDLSGSPVALSETDNYFYLVANVPGTAPLTTNIQVDLTTVGVIPGIHSSLAGFTRTFDIVALSATLNAINGGTDPVQLATLLEAGQTDRVLAGFSISSNGTQELSSINFNLSGLTAGQFTNLRLFRSTVAGSAGASILTDADSDGNFDDLSTVSVPDKTIDDLTVVYYYLVVDVLNIVTNNTGTYPNIMVAPTQANIIFATGGKNSLSINRTFSFTQSTSSDIVLSGGNVADITITDANTADENPGEAVTTANSSILATFTIRDGGEETDSDGLPTILDGLTIQIENHNNLDQIALFDQTDTKIPGTDKTPAATVNWTGLNYSTTDGGSRNFTIRASFKTVVTDNQETDIDIIATTSAAGTGSLFAATNAGGDGTSGTANHNRIEVVATKLVFADPSTLPTNPITAFRGPLFAAVAGQPNDTFSATVVAVDANNNIDLDATNSVTLNITPSAGVTFLGGGAASLSAGVNTFASLTISKADSYEVGATATGLTAASVGNNTSLSVAIQSAGVQITPANLAACKTDDTGSFVALPAITIAENDGADFGVGAAQTLLIVLPSGWEFNTATPTIVVNNNPSNFTSTAFSGYLGNTIAKFTYSVSGINRVDNFTISGLQVRNIGGVESGVITTGGTGVIKGCCDDVKPLGTLTTTPKTKVNFTVEAYPGQPVISPTLDLFPKSSTAILLKGELYPSAIPISINESIFSGEGVSKSFIAELPGNSYTFNPQIVDADQYYDITFTYKDGSGCLSDSTRTFHVYNSGISGLQTAYCADDDDVQPIAPIDQFKPTGTTYVKENGDQVYSLLVPSYRYITKLVNNGSTLTLTVKNHGLTNGQPYWIFIGYGFTGGADVQGSAPYTYVYKEFTVTVLTADTFTVPATVTGTWDQQYGYVYLPQQGYVYPTNVTNPGAGTTLTISAAGHGFQNGARPYFYTERFQIGVNFIQGFFAVQNATADSYDITLPAVPTPTAYTYAFVNPYWYKMTEFKPSLTLLNTKLANETFYELGYFVNYDGCGTNFWCDSYVNNTPIYLYATPVVSFSGLAPAPSTYCESNNAVSLVGSETSGTFSSTNGGVVPIGGGIGTFTPADVTTKGVSMTITYTYTNINGCQGTSDQITIVQQKSVEPTVSDVYYCQNIDGDGPSRIITATGTVPSAAITWWGDVGATQYLSSNAEYNTNFSDDAATSESYYATQQLPGECQSDAVEAILTIVASPSNVLSVPSACQEIDFSLNAPTDDGTPYDLYKWSFAGGGDTPALDVSNPGNNQITHQYDKAGVYPFTLMMTQSNTVTATNSCSTTITGQINVNSNPTTSFTYNYVCEGDGTQLNGSSLNDEAIRYAWFIATPDNVTQLWSIPEATNATPPPAPDGGTTQNPIHVFTEGAGDYLVTVRGFNNLNCYKDYSQVVTILDTLYYEPGEIYDMAAIGGGGNWTLRDFAGNSTWQFATPTTTYMSNLTGEAWVTNATGNYEPKENSVLNSPCLNIVNIPKPIVSINYVLNTERSDNRGVDGVVLEFSKDGGVTWFSLGNQNDGLNWFNTGIFDNAPIGSSNIGWSGNSWAHLVDNPDGDIAVTGRRALDNLGLTNAELKSLRFRIAFKTTEITHYEGFGFNSFKVEPRNRVLLTENFTNEHATGYTASKTIFNNIDTVDPFAARIQYHVKSPNPISGSSSEDSNTVINPADQSARAAFYGLVLTDTKIPRAFVDGVGSGSLADPWYASYNDKRALVPAPVEMTVIAVTPDEPNQLKVEVDITAIQDFPLLAGRKPIVHIAVVELIDGNNNEFVIRKFLPSPVGSALSLPITQGATVTVTETMLIENGMLPPDVALIAFIQDEITKEVYQSAINLTPTNIPSGITGTEDPTYSSKISLYPNPANRELHIALPAPVARPTLVNMVDTYGKVAHQMTFNTGEQQRPIDTAGLAAGVYIVQIGTPEGGVVYKKVVITH